MKFAFRSSLVILLLTASLSFADYTAKTGTKAPPKELADSIKALLSDEVIELQKNNKTVAEVWFAKTIPGGVAADKANKLIAYRDVKEGTLFGAVQFHEDWQDYRKQQVKAGVYTLRLGFQPQDGDHMGTSPFPEFLILTAPKFDNKGEVMLPKTLADRSATSINTTHPAVLLLFPNQMPKDKIELEAKAQDHWLLNLKKTVATENKGSATLGISFAIIGHTTE